MVLRLRTTLEGLLVVAIGFAATSTLTALPHKEDTIDPAKRAPVSTKDAIRPSASNPSGTGVVGDGRIPVTRASVPSSPVATPPAAVVVVESREKSVKKPGVRKPATTSRTFESSRASDQPAAIPRLDRERYRKTLTEYRAGAKSAADMTHQRVQVGQKSVDLADINRFADPRATLERQGIPVVSAGSQTEVTPSASTVPIPAAETSAAK